MVSKQNKSTKGFLTDEAKTNWSTQVAYTTDTYHLSLITALKYNGWTDSYYTTSLGKARPDGNSTNYGLRGYWRPDTESKQFLKYPLVMIFHMLKDKMQIPMHTSSD